MYSNENFEAFGLLCFGFARLDDWGGRKRQRDLHVVPQCQTCPTESWINELKPMAADYASDCDRVAEIEQDLVAVRNAESARALAKKVRATQEELKLGGKLATRLKSIEAELIAKGANP